MTSVGSKVVLNHLTFNTMGAPFKPDIDGRYRSMMEVFHKLIDKYDIHVITLQETFNEKLRDQHLVMPWKERYQWHVTHSKTGWFFLNSGLTTLSRLQIIESDFSAFSRAVGSDWFVKKGALHTRIQLLEDCFVDVFNSHTQASYISQRRRSNVRISQVQELLSFIISTHDPVYPVILTGDLNTEEYNIGYQMIVNNEEFNFLDLMRTLYPDKTIYPLKTLRRRDSRSERKLDHVFIREGRDWKLVLDECQTQILDFGLSDHKAVMSRIVFENRPEVQNP